MKRFYLFLLLFMFFNFSYACTNSNECFLTNCPGSVGTCVDNNCIFSECLFTSEFIVENEEVISNEYLRYSNDIVSSINISSNDIKKDKVFYNDVIEWTKLNTAIMFSVTSVFAVFILFLLLLLWQMIKTNAIFKVIIFLFLVVIVGSIVLIMLSNPEFFNRLSKGDFSVLSFSGTDDIVKIEKENRDLIISKDVFSNKALKQIDDSINYGKEIKFNYDDEQISVVSLEFNSVQNKDRYVQQKIKKTNTTDVILGRVFQIYYISKSDKITTYRIEDNNKIYLVSGNQESVRNFISNNFFEGKTNEPLRIFLDGKNCLNINKLNFFIRDRFNLIKNNNYDIKISGLKNTVNLSCDFGIDEVLCNIHEPFLFGKNNFEIGVYENVDNILKLVISEKFLITYDDISPEVNFIQKKEGVFVKMQDVGTKIDSFEIKLNSLDYSCENDCLIEKSNFLEGQNNISVFVKDSCDNQKLENFEFLFDNSAPMVTLVQKSPFILEIEDSSGVKKLSINKKEYEPNSCMIVNGVYICTYYNLTLPLRIYVEDYVGNFENLVIS